MTSAFSRKPGWRGALNQALSAEAGKPFVWGEHDCALGLVVPAIQAMTGQDLGEGFRGKYSDAEGAKAALKAAGFDDLGDMAAAYFPEINPHEVQIGDLAVIESSGTVTAGLGVGLGIVMGECIMVLSPHGKATVKISRAKRAFRVGSS
jgi:hypothetical protein